MFPSLHNVLIDNTLGLVDLALSSRSLVWLKLSHLRGLQRINVEAHSLEWLCVIHCLRYNLQVASFSMEGLKKVGSWFVYFSLASVLYLLRMCTGIRELSLKLPENSEVLNTCPLNCICDQQPNWRAGHILMKFLREAEILNFRGEDHELDLVKLLLRAAPGLRRLRITCHRSFAAWERLSEDLQSLASQETCVEKLHTCRTSVLLPPLAKPLGSDPPDLFFGTTSPHDSSHVSDALTAHAARADAAITQQLTVKSFYSATPDDTASWLRVAAPFVSGELRFRNRSMVTISTLIQELIQQVVEERGVFELPCFPKATAIRLSLGFLGLSLPPSGVFSAQPALRELRLEWNLSSVRIVAEEVEDFSWGTWYDPGFVEFSEMPYLRMDVFVAVQKISPFSLVLLSSK
ncbi:hypothetical protein GUJ93_ZPchr0007g4445 [Zizania palustris]|uniref:Uncharacterized protein n=1 Tax=Zizania palustris TaxID=103762 RepID=A0A8J5VTN2_ZIZPA|nr:hypothetical protein GUJ93_ZPchr0007g4445 [Zizania palustris]